MWYIVAFFLGTIFGFTVFCINAINRRFPDDEEQNNNAQKAYIVELSNGTKFLAFLRAFGYAQVEEILSEKGEQANIEADQQKNAQITKMMIHKLNSSKYGSY